MNAKVLGILVLLTVLCVFLSFAAPDSFLKGNNIENLLRRTAMYGILGIGVAFVIITSGIDLSIGSVVCLSGCLLALFLRVVYEPFDVQDVAQVRAEQRTIAVPGRVEHFQTGDRIRYYGGRRADSAMMAVTDVEFDDSPDGGNTVISVDQQLSRDDTDGKIAKIYKIKTIEAGVAENQSSGSTATITIHGSLPLLDARDKVWLVHSSAGLKDLKVLASVAGETSTVITVPDDVGTLDTSWVAIPRKRSQRMPVVVGVVAVLSIGLVLGLIHGLLVSKLTLRPFVVTLCGLLIYRGFSRWIVDDQVVGLGDEYVDTLSPIGSGKLLIWQSADGLDSFGIPYPFLILVFTAVVAAVFLNKTIWGRYMLALGRNEEAARYCGINTDRMTILAYMISTVLAVTGGMLFALDSNSVSPSSFGDFFELYAIAAAVLGGCSLRGGEGGILGVVIGTALMQTLYNLIVLLRISDTLEFAIIGLVILVGVAADEIVKRIATRSV